MEQTGGSQDQSTRSLGVGAVTVAAIWAVMTSVGLAVWVAVGSGEFSPILLVPCLAALVAYVRPRSVWALTLALVLLSAAILLLLIGFTGLLYLQAWFLLLRALVSTARQRAREE